MVVTDKCLIRSRQGAPVQGILGTEGRERGVRRIELLSESMSAPAPSHLSGCTKLSVGRRPFQVGRCGTRRHLLQQHQQRGPRQLSCQAAAGVQYLSGVREIPSKYKVNANMHVCMQDR